jgi:putative hydrolase of the HAD superfamily
LSNDVKEWGKYLREKYNLNRLFKEVVMYKNSMAASERGLRTIRFCRKVQEKTFEPDDEISSFAQLKKVIKDIWQFYS